LIEEYQRLLGSRDFEGAEDLLAAALGGSPKIDGHLHFQLGRLYVQWNKLTSALNHLLKAAELAKGAGDEIFVLQVMEEIKLAKQMQLRQCP
jgi:hypothetical protein